MNSDSHVDIRMSYFTNSSATGLLGLSGKESLLCKGHMSLLYGFNHAKAHHDAIIGMLGPTNWKARHAIVTISQDFDAHALIFLGFKKIASLLRSFKAEETC